ncbi:MAG: thiamine phosphate synthase [Syntrophales bacterium]|nr:thiamine phosphate synthase [Syntrophales bacterium]
MTSKKKILQNGLYCITGEEFSRGRTNIQVVREMIAADIKTIQYREKEKHDRDKYQECLEIRKMTEDAGVVFIVNDDVALALSVKADGVHIGQDDLPFHKVRELTGRDMIIGFSTHSPRQAREAVAMGADYIGVGPIFRTFTKKDVCEPVGLEYLDYAVGNCPIPFVAIGGIKEDNIAQVAGRGARIICAVTEILEADNIREKILSLRGKMELAAANKSVPPYRFLFT